MGEVISPILVRHIFILNLQAHDNLRQAQEKVTCGVVLVRSHLSTLAREP
ncbi:MAG: hypothetical protein F6K31_18470 [Symploca sp. SIO2G7]|nr:hypothetical protein [Symploca sp. SIO2G7]